LVIDSIALDDRVILSCLHEISSGGTKDNHKRICTLEDKEELK